MKRSHKADLAPAMRWPAAARKDDKLLRPVETALDQSPRMMAQRRLIASLSAGQRVVAQRQQIERTFGSAARLLPADLPPVESDIVARTLAGQLRADEVRMPALEMGLPSEAVQPLAEQLQGLGQSGSLPLAQALRSGKAQVEQGRLNVPGLPPTPASGLGAAVGTLGAQQVQLQIKGNKYQVMSRLNPWLKVVSGTIQDVYGAWNKGGLTTPPWEWVTAKQLRAGGLDLPKNPKKLIGKAWTSRTVGRQPAATAAASTLPIPQAPPLTTPSGPVASGTSSSGMLLTPQFGQSKTFVPPATPTHVASNSFAYPVTPTHGRYPAMVRSPLTGGGLPPSAHRNIAQGGLVGTRKRPRVDCVNVVDHAGKVTHRSGLHEGMPTSQQVVFFGTPTKGISAGSNRALGGSHGPISQSSAISVASVGDSNRTDTASTVMAYNPQDGEGPKVAGHSHSLVSQTGQDTAHGHLRRVHTRAAEQNTTPKTTAAITIAATVGSIAPLSHIRLQEQRTGVAIEPRDRDALTDLVERREAGKSNAQGALEALSPGRRAVASGIMQGFYDELNADVTPSSERYRPMLPGQTTTPARGGADGEYQVPLGARDAVPVPTGESAPETVRRGTEPFRREKEQGQ